MAKKKQELDRSEKIALARKLIKEKYPGVKLLMGNECGVDVAVTGIPAIDEMIRGFRRGGYSILWGPEGAGKTTLVMYTIRSEQEKGKACVYVSAENRFDSEWARNLGVSTKDLIVMEQGRNLEDYMMSIETLVKERLVDTVIIDSLTALVPVQELQDKKDKTRDLHDDGRATQARKLSQWFRRTTPLIAANKVAMILIGQGRTEGMDTGMARLGLAGGRAQKYYSSTTLKIFRSNTGAPTAALNGVKRRIGFKMHIQLDKTSLTPNEGSEVVLDFVFGIGLDLGRGAVEEAILAGKIDASKKGWYVWADPETGEEHKIHGKENLMAFFGDETMIERLKS